MDRSLVVKDIWCSRSLVFLNVSDQLVSLIWSSTFTAQSPYLSDYLSWEIFLVLRISSAEAVVQIIVRSFVDGNAAEIVLEYFGFVSSKLRDINQLDGCADMATRNIVGCLSVHAGLSSGKCCLYRFKQVFPLFLYGCKLWARYSLDLDYVLIFLGQREMERK